MFPVFPWLSWLLSMFLFIVMGIHCSIDFIHLFLILIIGLLSITSVELVLEGQVSQACISWLSDDPRLPIRNLKPIITALYKFLSVLSAGLLHCSGAEYPPPSPASLLVHSQDLAF